MRPRQIASFRKRGHGFLLRATRKVITAIRAHIEFGGHDTLSGKDTGDTQREHHTCIQSFIHFLWFVRYQLFNLYYTMRHLNRFHAIQTFSRDKSLRRRRASSKACCQQSLAQLGMLLLIIVQSLPVCEESFLELVVINILHGDVLLDRHAGSRPRALAHDHEDGLHTD